MGPLRRILFSQPWIGVLKLSHVIFLATAEVELNCGGEKMAVKIGELEGTGG